MPWPNYRDAVMRANIIIPTTVCLHGTTGGTDGVQGAPDPYQACPAPTVPTQPSQMAAKKKGNKGSKRLPHRQLCESAHRNQEDAIPPALPLALLPAGQARKPWMGHEQTFACTPLIHVSSRFLRPWNSQAYYSVPPFFCPNPSWWDFLLLFLKQILPEIHPKPSFSSGVAGKSERSWSFFFIMSGPPSKL